MAVFYHQFDKIMNLCKHSQSRIVCIYYYCRICILYTVMETTIPLHWCRKWKKTQYLTIPITSRQRVRISDGPHQNILSDTRRTTVDSKIVFDHKGNKREKMKGRFRATFKATGRVGSLLSFWLKSTLSYFPFYQLHCHGEDNVRNAAMFLNQCAYWKPGDLSAKDLQLLLKRCSNDLFLTRRCYLCAAHISFSPESGYLKFFFFLGYLKCTNPLLSPPLLSQFSVRPAFKMYSNNASSDFSSRSGIRYFWPPMRCAVTRLQIFWPPANR